MTVDDLPEGFTATWIRDRSGNTVYMSRKMVKTKNWLHALYNRILFRYNYYWATGVSMGLFHDGIDHSFDQAFFTSDGKPIYYIYRSYFADGQGYKGIAPWLRWVGGDVS